MVERRAAILCFNVMDHVETCHGPGRVAAVGMKPPWLIDHAVVEPLGVGYVWVVLDQPHIPLHPNLKDQPRYWTTRGGYDDVRLVDE